MNWFKLFAILGLGVVFAACGSPAETPTRAASSTPAAAFTRASPSNTTAPTPLPPTDASSPTALPPTTAPLSTPPAPTNTRVVSDHAPFSIRADPYITDLVKPVFVTPAGDGTARLFIVEQAGQILVAENGRVRATSFLDIRDKVNPNGSERGLLSVAFHPDYRNNGIFFVDYTAQPDGATVVERYHVSSDPNVADENSGKVILTFAQPEPNHNGGMLAFGPDGYLYIGTGDGGGAGDQHGTMGNGQSLNTLLGKILRLDVNADTYQIPPTNPFVNQANARPEIWAYGLRNPWRFSFDRATGDLYIADVGQNKYEEVDFQPAASGGGENYGWRLMEGNHCFNPAQNCDTGNLVKPIAEYTHDFGCAITGGYVYRGQAYPWLVGQYIFADYCTGIVWATARDANGQWQTQQVGKFDDTISSFGQDESGEMFVVGHGNGVIYKLTASQ
jgi:glucose/arabinose dehydrogenase